jgi:anti-sigma-K factor RskA
MPEKPTPQNDELNHDSSGHLLNYADAIELLPSFVLGALEPDEMLAVEAYVQQHQALLKRLVSLEAATAQLAYATPQIPLPSQAKTKLMERVKADLVASQPRARTATLPLFPPRRAPAVSISPRPPRPFNQPTATQPRSGSAFSFGRVLRPLVGVAIAAALLLLVLGTAQLWNTTNRLTVQLASTQQLATLLQNRNAQLQKDKQGLEQQIAQLANAQTQMIQLQAKNAQLQQVNQSLLQQLKNQDKQLAVFEEPQRQIPLLGKEPAPDATGTFLIHNDTGVLVLRGLKPLPANQGYQLWFIPANGAPRPSDVVQIRNNTVGTLTVTIPETDRNFAVLGVTIEPVKGSRAPTGPLVLVSAGT